MFCSASLSIRTPRPSLSLRAHRHSPGQRSFGRWLLTLALLLAPLSAGAQEERNVTLAVTPVRGSVSMVHGVGGFAGGNVGVSVGDDGLFVIDDQLEKVSPKLLAALAALSSHPLRFVINTHWHGDHSGGNAALQTGGAIVLAHDRVRERLVTVARKEAQERAAGGAPGLPVLTFQSDITLHLNGDTIVVFHVPPAHTDGDSVVYFKKANVIHTGDLFLSRGYPYVDLGSGGNFEGFIGAAKRILALCNEDTKVIPGHGEIAGRREVAFWHDTLSTIRDRVRALIEEGKTLQEAVAAKPTADLDQGMGANFVSSDQIVEAAYRSMRATRP